ncbi:MAG TPA: restriction endonuclease subunit S [Paludibacteraceae bacterium]|nr:restriction endonuclease subunit S [Paludibacteraceae bacterium]HPQ13097.1 restriction endonuclease subunit S [Paludibacteraceae bacterium]
MSQNNENKLVPRLRFPEFAMEGEWEILPLSKLSYEITEKTKGRKFKLMSITSGVGLVSQIEKFGKEIAGNSYDNYYVLKKGDFAYNKSSTKLYPEGEVAMLEKEENGAVPNSIFTCFSFDKNKIYPIFAKYPFINNIHGRWLKKFIAVGARANGALQVNSKDLFSIPFPYPSFKEQQKIAACLSSLDDVITAESKKLEVLKEHKKGLLQNLFPQEGETVPKLRFKEFEDSGEWVERTLGEVSDNVMYGMNSAAIMFDGENKYIRITDIDDNTRLFSPNPLTSPDGQLDDKYFVNVGDILFARTGASVGKSYLHQKENGKIYFAGFLIRFTIKNANPYFIYLQTLTEKYQKWVSKTSLRSGQPGINAEEFKSYPILISSLPEQQRIASCLSSLDNLINAQSQKIETLKLHKKGLLQGLFPDVNEHNG